MPGLNACFVDVGYEKDAFLHYLDLGPQFNSLDRFTRRVTSNRKKLAPISKLLFIQTLKGWYNIRRIKSRTSCSSSSKRAHID